MEMVKVHGRDRVGAEGCRARCDRVPGEHNRAPGAHDRV